MLLFERLVDFAPQERTETSHVERDDDIAASIRRELGRLLQTRRPIDLGEALDNLPMSVCDYGIPDISTISPSCDDDRAALAQAIRQAILVYEPRLEHPVVTVDRTDQQSSALHVLVTGRLRGHSETQRLRFPLQLTEG